MWHVKVLLPYRHGSDTTVIVALYNFVDNRIHFNTSHSISGMGKEVENLIMENNELLATK